MLPLRHATTNQRIKTLKEAVMLGLSFKAKFDGLSLAGKGLGHEEQGIC